MRQFFLLVMLMGLPRAAEARTSLLILPVEARNPALKEGAESITTLIAGELRRRRTLSIVTIQEVESTMSMDQRRQIAGCDSVSCAADIAGALNTDEILLSSLGQVGEHNLVLSMSRIKAGHAVVAGSSVRRVQADDVGKILDEIPGMVCELLGDCGGLVGGLGIRLPPAETTAPQPPAPAQTAYDEKYLEIRERVLVSSSKNGTTMTPELYPVQGKYARELGWDEFYETVGREDLAEAFRRGRIRRWTLIGVGTAAVALAWLPFLASWSGMGAAVVVGLLIVGAAGFLPFLVLMGVGGGAVALGLVTMLAGYVVGAGLLVGGFLAPLHSVAPDEWRRMADGYNARLRDAAPHPSDDG